MSEERTKIGPSGRKIILDKDGKPSVASSASMNPKPFSEQKNANDSKSNELKLVSPKESDPAQARDCPADVEVLGRSTWTFLHSVAATYPENPTKNQQSDAKQLMSILGRLYPCWFCAEDFEKWSKKNEPKVKTQEEFGRWLCDAHNAVNVKLGKPKFDCNLWRQRWKDGWEDGRCD